ncbi:hypothetical protein OROGR_008377 [Orobanche gracilis]
MRMMIGLLCVKAPYTLRFARNVPVTNYMKKTTHLGMIIRQEMASGCVKAGIGPNEYYDAVDFLKVAYICLGVYIYMDIKKDPSSGGVPFLSEINVAHVEDEDGTMRRIDHPGFHYVKSGLFFLVHNVV